MSTVTKATVKLPRVDLIETDGEPLESDWHRAAIALLIEIVSWLFRERSDYYVGGNMFIYYSEEQARTRKYRGPDFFYVDGVKRLPQRPYWVVWREGGRYPDVIIELLSKKTEKTEDAKARGLETRRGRTLSGDSTEREGLVVERKVGLVAGHMEGKLPGRGNRVASLLRSSRQTDSDRGRGL